MSTITAPIAEDYGKPQLKVIENYLKSINTIASGRASTSIDAYWTLWEPDRLAEIEKIAQFWIEIRDASFALLGKVEDILNPDDLGL